MSCELKGVIVSSCNKGWWWGGGSRIVGFDGECVLGLGWVWEMWRIGERRRGSSRDWVKRSWNFCYSFFEINKLVEI